MRLQTKQVALNLTPEMQDKFLNVCEKYGLSVAELIRIVTGLFLEHSDAITPQEMWELAKKYRRVPRRDKKIADDQKELDFVGEQA